MKKSPFLIFIFTVGLLIAAVVMFIQSTQFAGLVKRVVAQKLPANLGIEGDFSEFAVKLFPPGVSIRNPHVSLTKNNVLNLPSGSTVSAKRMDLIFLPFQMFSGNIRVNNVVIADGDVRLAIDKGFLQGKSQKKSKGSGLHWDELLKIRADAVTLENTRVHLKFLDPEMETDWTARNLTLARTTNDTGLGYDLSFLIRDIQGTFPKAWKIPRNFEQISVDTRINTEGVEIRDVSLVLPGVEIHTSGAIKGNLLEPKSLLTELELQLKSNLSQLSELGLDVTRQFPSARGLVTFKGKVKGNLERPMETLRAEGSLGIQTLRVDSWEAETVAADGTWIASPQGGELSIAKASIRSPERKRTGSHTSGHGGRIEVGAFRYRFGSSDRITVPLTLERAHIHWFTAHDLKHTFPLDFRINGPMKVDFTPAAPGRPWDIKANLDFAIDDFQFDNQKIGENKPLKRIFKVPHLRLLGDLAVDQNSFRPLGMTLSFPRSRGVITGKIDFKSGFDLHADAQVNLEDLGEIAEKPISGEGPLKVLVHGTLADPIVDIDADLKNASYIGLLFGDVRGRFSYLDGPTRLDLTNLTAVQGVTTYHGNGSINLKGEDTIALDIDVPDGKIQDFLRVFDHLTEKLSWFPRKLSGDVEGKVRISSGLSLDKIQIVANIIGTNWDYLGERFKALTLRGGFDRGKYWVDLQDVTKHGGAIAGHVSYDTQERFDWVIRTNGLTISDLDHIASLDVPIRGKLKIDSTGKGKLGSIESSTQVALIQMAVRGTPMQPSMLSVSTANGIANIKSVVMGGQGAFEMAYDSRPGSRGYIRGELKKLDFSPALLLLNPKLMQDRELSGLISGAVNLDFKSGEMELATGKIDFTEYTLAKSGTHFHLAQPVSVKTERGNFDLRDLILQGDRGEANLTVSGRGARLDGAVSGDLDISVVEFLTSAVAKAQGVANLDFSLGGSLKSPEFFGKANLAGAMLKVPSLESPFENITGALQLRQNVITLQNIEADLANGRFSAGGTVELFANQLPKLDLVGNLYGNKIKVFPFQYAKVRGRVSVHGNDLPYLVDGKITVDSALSKEKIFNQAQGLGLKTAQYMPAPTFREESNYPRFKLNIDVVADNGVIFQNELFDAEMKANMTIVNTLEAPRIVGTADMIQGKMIFKDRSFQVQSANVEFDNPSIMNPKFNLSANTDVNGTKIQIYAAGRLPNKYKIELSSNPALPESEILSLLAIGLTNDELRHMRSADSSVYEQSEAASLLFHSLGVNQDVQEKTGFQVKLDEAVNQNIGTSIFRPRSDTDSTTAPKIVIKRQVLKRVDVSVGSTVGVGTNNQKEVNAEVHVTPAFSVLGVWDYVEGTNGQDTTKSPYSYGVDLKLQKRFR